MDDLSEAGRDEERRRVLGLLGQGQISAAEADELLAALEGRSAAEEPQPLASPRPVAQQPATVSGLQAAAVSLARALARAIGRLSIVVGGVIGVLARLSGRAPTQGRPHDR